MQCPPGLHPPSAGARRHRHRHNALSTSHFIPPSACGNAFLFCPSCIAPSSSSLVIFVSVCFLPFRLFPNSPWHVSFRGSATAPVSRRVEEPPYAAHYLRAQDPRCPAQRLHTLADSRPVSGSRIALAGMPHGAASEGGHALPGSVMACGRSANESVTAKL